MIWSLMWTYLKIEIICRGCVFHLTLVRFLIGCDKFFPPLVASRLWGASTTHKISSFSRAFHKSCYSIFSPSYFGLTLQFLRPLPHLLKLLLMLLFWVVYHIIIDCLSNRLLCHICPPHFFYPLSDWNCSSELTSLLHFIPALSFMYSPMGLTFSFPQPFSPVLFLPPPNISLALFPFPFSRCGAFLPP